jgi:NitT/TauT family transport system substrate-binding protein
MAKDKGLFRKHGVDLELISVMSQLAIASLFAGEIDVAVGGGVVLLALHAQGRQDVVGFASLNNKLNYSVYAHPSITSVAALRGKKFGVTRFGGALDFASRYYLKRSGLNPNKDLTLIQIGTVPDLLTALVAGSVDAAMLPLPQNLTAQAQGFHELADLTQTDARYPGATFMATKRTVSEKRASLEAFIASVIEGVYYTRVNRNEALAILSRYTRITDPKSLSQSYEYGVKNVWARIPELRVEDMKLVVEHLSETNPKARGSDLSGAIDSSIIENVVKSGFLNQLYKNKSSRE